MVLFPDKIRIANGGTNTDLALNVSGQIIIDEEKSDDLIAGKKEMITEKIDVSLEVVKGSTADYNALRSCINQDVDVSFMKGVATLVTAKEIRIYPKWDAKGGDAIRLMITGGKKFDTDDDISLHITLPS